MVSRKIILSTSSEPFSELRNPILFSKKLSTSTFHHFFEKYFFRVFAESAFWGNFQSRSARKNKKMLGVASFPQLWEFLEDMYGDDITQKVQNYMHSGLNEKLRDINSETLKNKIESAHHRQKIVQKRIKTAQNAAKRVEKYSDVALTTLGIAKERLAEYSDEPTRNRRVNGELYQEEFKWWTLQLRKANTLGLRYPKAGIIGKAHGPIKKAEYLIQWLQAREPTS